MPQRRLRKGLVAAACLCGWLAPTCGLAQTQPVEVTFEDVLAQPDDLEINFAYARQQADAGKLEQAAGTLERLLLLRPDWDAARLFYASVLYRLDDLEGAKREYEILEGRDLTPEQAREVERYLHLATAGAKPTRISGSVSAGAAYDSNPAAIPATGLAAPRRRGERGDASAVAAGELRVEHELATGQGDLLFVQADGWTKRQSEIGIADVAIGRIEAGATLYGGDLSITPRGIYAATMLADESYLQEYGAGLAAGYVVSPSLTLLSDVIWLSQDFRDVSFSTVDGRRSGTMLSAGGGFSARLTQRDTLTLQAFHLDKEAEDPAFAYRGFEIRASNLLLLGQGQYIWSELRYWRNDYEAPDPRYDPGRAREDHRLLARLAYGVPLGTLTDLFGGTRSGSLDSVNLQVSGSYYRQDSNIRSLDLENWGMEFLVTKRFEF